MITDNKYNVVLELEPEDVLVLTTLIQTFRNTTTALEMEVPEEMKLRIVSILQRLTLELYDALGEEH